MAKLIAQNRYKVTLRVHDLYCKC